MSRYAPAAILCIVAISAVHAADRPSRPDTPGVLTGLSIANFAGSTITLFLTGAGATDPPVSPGSIAQTLGITPVTPLYSSWETAGPGPGQSAIPETVTSVPGFVSSMFQIQMQVPANIQNLPGTDLGNGIRRVQVGLELGVLVEPVSPLASNLIFLYVN
jgi:uncharacterized protein (TIGR03437 family)